MPDETNNSMRLKGILILCAALTAASCAGSGEGLDENGEPVPPAPPPNTDFQQIQATIFTPICTTCHVGANAPRGLRLDAANSYALLVNVPSSQVPSLMRVNPGDPNSSYLVQKIEGTAAVGVRMPANGPPYLSQAQIDLVRGWIAAGAPQSSAPAAPLQLVSSVPAPAEKAAAGVDRLTLVFNGEVDASLVGPHTLTLRDGFDQEVPLLRAQVPPGRPQVIEVQLPRGLGAGSYQLEVRGSGSVALADAAGRVLDGDADGASGGDALIPFDVQAGVSR
jgi:methionine-rich copper-binding protein CopC